MNESTDFEKLSELPQSLIFDAFEQIKDIEQELLKSFDDLRERKKEFREKLNGSGLLKHDASLPEKQSPTTCGVDGAYAIDKLLATDLVVVGAVAVEGFTPPTEKRFWPEPQHFVHIGIEPHHEDTISIFRAVMIGTELTLAQKAPHDLVLLDGSLTTPLIFFNQGFAKAKRFPNPKTKEWLAKQVKEFLDAYCCVLAPQRNDRQWVSVVKYSKRKEIITKLKLGSDSPYDDRGLLSSVLEAGEYTDPLPLEPPETPWNLSASFVNAFLNNDECTEINRLKDQVLELLKTIHVLYYRPRVYMPALRIEMSHVIVNNPHRLAIVLRGIKDQYGKAAIMEPYPLYMADRMVKHLAQVLAASRHRISQNLAENYEGDINDVFNSLHSYRTEQGR